MTEMKPSPVLLPFMLLLAIVASAQSRPERVSLCKLVGDAQKYEGKFVEVSGTVTLGEFFLLTDSNCENAATLDYPNDKMRPVARFRVLRDKQYFALQRALTFDHPHVRTDRKPPQGSMVLAELFRTASVRATIVGRVDARHAGGFDGGGEDTPVRIVIRRVATVEPLSDSGR